MFVALNVKNRTRVTSISAQWDGQEEVLREMASMGELVCPGCDQLLWLRTGIVRRRHFAHRHLADCRLGQQSAERLEAKAQLFDWLETKYPGRVHLDQTLGVPRWDRFIDLVVTVEPGRKFAYWVFDRVQRSRAEILGYETLPGVQTHYIHTQSTLKVHTATTLALNASQRDFIASSEFDAGLGYGYGGHLHFLDPADSKLHIYRGLRRIHEPNVYTWEALRSDLLSAARISPKTGEMVFPADVEARDERRRRLEQAKKPAPPAPAVAPPSEEPADLADSALEDEDEAPPVIKTVPVWQPKPKPQPQPRPAPRPEPSEPLPSYLGPFRCEDCGIETTAWSEAAPAAGTCVCHACATERWRRRAANQPAR